jgi:hypothetical protein
VDLAGQRGSLSRIALAEAPPRGHQDGGVLKRASITASGPIDSPISPQQCRGNLARSCDAVRTASRPACLTRLRQYPGEPKPIYITPWMTPPRGSKRALRQFMIRYTRSSKLPMNTAKLKSVIVRSGMHLFAGCDIQSNENARDLVGRHWGWREISLPPPRRLLPFLTRLYVRWEPNSGYH